MMSAQARPGTDWNVCQLGLEAGSYGTFLSVLALCGPTQPVGKPGARGTWLVNMAQGRGPGTKVADRGLA